VFLSLQKSPKVLYDMSSMKKNSMIPASLFALPVLLILTAALPLSAAESSSDIRFSSRYTRASMRNEEKSLLLSGNAWVETGNTRIQADEIELYGAESRYIDCSGNVIMSDSSQEITLTANRAFYDRVRQVLRIDGWAEMEDSKNGIIARGAYLEYAQQTGITLIQISVRIFKDTKDGPMTCMTDSALYDNKSMQLEMTGDSAVYWKSNTYKAAKISIGLEDNEITMEGSVRGTINE
jgi:lipopolysaccharide export system protein LptA